MARKSTAGVFTGIPTSTFRRFSAPTTSLGKPASGTLNRLIIPLGLPTFVTPKLTLPKPTPTNPLIPAAKIPNKPIRATTNVIQPTGSGVGRLKTTFAFAFTPEGKLNIPLLALGIAAASLLLRK